ncbi:MAG: chromosomal replication initiator DnaA [Proteobacteria bacterium]|nr:chromosomal replication initiator DnaA [Pseudomonadota bacterium]
MVTLGEAARCALTERLSEACAAAWQAVPHQHLRRPTRCVAPVAAARQTAIYFAHVFFAANLTRAGRMVGRDRTTARHACARIEDWRDDADIDRAFNLFEPALRVWLETFIPEEEA